MRTRDHRPAKSAVSRRSVLKSAAAVSLLSTGFPMINSGSYQAFADSPKKYSAKTMRAVERALVIDMLAPLKLDFTPEAYAGRMTDAEAEMFRSCGITGFHNSVGTGGPNAVEETLQFMTAWQGYAGRNTHVFTLVNTAADLDRAKSER